MYVPEASFQWTKTRTPFLYHSQSQEGRVGRKVKTDSYYMRPRACVLVIETWQDIQWEMERISALPFHWMLLLQPMGDQAMVSSLTLQDWLQRWGQEPQLMGICQRSVEFATRHRPKTCARTHESAWYPVTLKLVRIITARALYEQLTHQCGLTGFYLEWRIEAAPGSYGSS